MNLTRLVVAVAALSLIAPVVPATPPALAVESCTTTWVGPLSGVVPFATPTSWSGGASPTTSDVVCFPATAAVRFQLQSPVVGGWDIAPGGSVTLDSSTLTVAGAADLGGLIARSSRMIVGAGSTVSAGEQLAMQAGSGVVDPGSADVTLTVEDGASLVVDTVTTFGVDVVNSGEIVVNGFFARMMLRPGTGVTNLGTIRLTGAATVSAPAGTPVPTVVNEPGASVVVDGPAFVPLACCGLGDAAQFAGVDFANRGTMHVRSGQAALASVGVHTGRFQVDAGAQLGLSGASNVFAAGSVVEGGGIVRTNVFGVPNTTAGVVVDAAASMTVGELHVTTGRIAVHGDRVLPDVSMTSGVLAISGNAVIEEQLAVVPGQSAVVAGTGTLTVGPDATFSFGGGNAIFLREAIRVINEGTIVQSGATVGLEGTARVVNRSRWTITESADVGLATGTVLRNEGVMTIDGPADSQIGFSGTLDNVGTIEVRTGRVDFRSTPVAQMAAGVLTGGTWVLADGTTWFGFPSVATIDGATVVLRGSAVIQRTGPNDLAFDNLRRIGVQGRLDLLDGATVDTRRGVPTDLVVAGDVSMSGEALLGATTLTIEPSAQFRLELGGAAPGAVHVAGAAAVGGDIVATRGPGDVAEGVYPFVTATTLTGAFDGVTGPGEPPVSVRRVGSVIELVVGEAPAVPLPTATLTGANVREGTDEVASIAVALDEPAGPGGVAIGYETFAPGPDGGAPARAGIDYEPVSGGVVTVPAGQREARILVPVLDDEVHEQPSLRSFGVRITSGVTAGDAAHVNVRDDDPLPRLTIGGSVVTERDEDSVEVFTIAADSDADWDRCLGVFVRPGDASLGDDVLAAADGWVGDVTLPAGSRTVDVDVVVVGDDVAEPLESFELEVREGCLREALTPVVVATTTVDIIDDDTPLSGALAPTTLELDEGTSGTFTLQLDDASPVDREVRLTIRPSTVAPIGEADLDPLDDDGRFVIPAGAVSVTVPTVSARADGIFEGAEVAWVEVRDGATRVAEGAVVVANTDPRPTVAVIEPTADGGVVDLVEGTTSPATVRDRVVELELSGPTEIPLVYGFAVVGGNVSVGAPLVGTDVVFPPGPIGGQRYLVPPGPGRASITMGIMQDGMAEAGEFFVVDFDLGASAPTDTIEYRLLDDDPTLRLPPSPAVEEGDALTVVLDIPVPVESDRVFDVRVIRGSLTEPDDVVDTSASVVVPAGASSVELPPVIALTDDRFETPEFVEYVVVDAAGELVDRRPVAIVSTDEVPTASIVGPTTFTEGSRGITRFETITARLDRVSEIDLRYPVNVDGDAVVSDAQVFVFPAGSREATIQVGIVEDSVEEPDGSFTITATGTGTRRPVTPTTFTIVDDDAADGHPVLTEVRYDSLGALVEITNPLGQPIDLDGYRVVVFVDFGNPIVLELGGTLGVGATRLERVTFDGEGRPAGVRLQHASTTPLSGTGLLPGEQFRLRSGVALTPPLTDYYEVIFGATMGTHRFEPDTTAPTWSGATRVAVSTTSTAATIRVSYDPPIATDGSEAAGLGSCSPQPGSSFAVGTSTTVKCTAVDPYGNTSSTSFPVVVDRVSGASSGLTPAGQTVVTGGSGFAPRRPVRIILRSEPVLLAEVDADDSGRVARTVVLPRDTTPGPHTITIEGVAPDGSPRLVVSTIDVGRPCTITGTARGELIIGTSRADVICAGGGNDVIFALGGDDVVYGGAGNDVIDGGAGDDHLDGGDGFDLVIGGPGRDVVIGEIRFS